MRDLLLALLVLTCACNPTDDTKTGSGSGTTTGGASDSTTGGSEGTTAPTTGDAAECGGTYLCLAADAAACEADKCCVAAYGRRYEQDGDAWCLRAEEEYVGCAHKYNSAPCDHTGTIQCTDVNDEEYLAELDTECFPHACMTGTTPNTGGAVCGE